MSSPGTPQLSFRAVVLAIVLAVVLSAANAYLGLFAGLTVATAIPAAVVSMGVLSLLGGGTILENNIVQTCASAGSSIAAGVIFTIPALIILGYWQDFQYSWVLAIAGLGGLLGVLFSVPLRRSMIVEEPLPFPEGKAAAEVLKAGENPGPGLAVVQGTFQERGTHTPRTRRSTPSATTTPMKRVPRATAPGSIAPGSAITASPSCSLSPRSSMTMLIGTLVAVTSGPAPCAVVPVISSASTPHESRRSIGQLLALRITRPLSRLAAS